MRGYIYGITDAAGVVRYVGKTTQTPALRFVGHLYRDPRAEHLPLKRWLVRHGDEAQVIELDSGDWTAAELDAAEVEWIARYGLDNLLNVAPGGQGGPELAALSKTPEAIARWRASREANGWKRRSSGHPISAEEHERRSAASKRVIAMRRARGW